MKFFPLLLLVLSVSLPVAAQEPGEGADRPALEEIIVTATLREVALQDTPMSLGVLTGDDLQDIGAVSIDDVWRQIPNLAVRDAPFGGRSFIIRGLADTDSFLSTESINAFYVDDTPITYVSGLFNTPGDVSMLDLQRVEVLRGPQGTLVGANAMGGAVRFITNEPDLEDIGVYVEANLSSTNEGGLNYGGKVAWNQPTGSNSALRLAVLHQDDDGFIDDIGLGRKDVNNQERTAGRLSWLWNIGDQWELLARVYAENVETGGYNYADDVGRPWSGMPTNGEYQVVLSVPERREEELSTGSLRLRWQGDWGEFYSATSLFEKDLFHRLDWSVENFFFFEFDNPAVGGGFSTQEDFTQEFRFSSRGDGRYNWLAGTFYLDQDYMLDEFLISPDIPQDFLGFPAGGDVVYVDGQTRSTRKEKALFGEISWRFSDALEGVLGLRWFDYERRQRVEGGGLFVIPATAEGGSDGVSPKASLSWDLSGQTMIYGLVSEGFRPGQFNNPGSIVMCGSRPIIDDDQLTNYEVGVKHRSANGSFQLNTSVFHVDWSDMQFNAFGDCGFPVLENVGKATSQGFEADFNWLVTKTFRLQGGMGYNDAQLDSEFVNDNANVPAGTRIPNVPEWTANLAGTWEFDWDEGMPGYLRADAQYIDERTTLFDETIEFPTYRRIDDYTLVNFRLGLQSGNLATELFVTNLFDERAEMFCCRNFYDPAVARPRTVGLRSSFEFR